MTKPMDQQIDYWDYFHGGPRTMDLGDYAFLLLVGGEL